MASRIHKRKNGKFCVYFLDPVSGTKGTKQMGTKTKLEDAIDLASKCDIDFYSKHTYLVPSGITFDKNNGRFRVYNRFHIYDSHKTLMEAIEQKHMILNDLTSMKYLKKGTGLITN